MALSWLPTKALGSSVRLPCNAPATDTPLAWQQLRLVASSQRYDSCRARLRGMPNGLQAA
eukprot:5542397-Alexandrium_andersonii.AAC.1